MRVVADTNVIVAALRSPRGASAELLQRAVRGQVELAMTVALCLEYEAVCLRPEHVQASGLATWRIQAFLDVIAAHSLPTRIRYSWRPQLNDPADEMVLEAAVNGQADAIVTFNIKDFRGVTSRFGISVLEPAEFFRRER